MISRLLNRRRRGVAERYVCPTSLHKHSVTHPQSIKHRVQDNVTNDAPPAPPHPDQNFIPNTHPLVHAPTYPQTPHRTQQYPSPIPERVHTGPSGVHIPSPSPRSLQPPSSLTSYIRPQPAHTSQPQFHPERPLANQPLNSHDYRTVNQPVYSQGYHDHRDYRVVASPAHHRSHVPPNQDDVIVHSHPPDRPKPRPTARPTRLLIDQHDATPRSQDPRNVPLPPGPPPYRADPSLTRVVYQSVQPREDLQALSVHDRPAIPIQHTPPPMPTVNISEKVSHTDTIADDAASITSSVEDGHSDLGEPESPQIEDNEIKVTKRPLTSNWYSLFFSSLKPLPMSSNTIGRSMDVLNHHLIRVLPLVLTLEVMSHRDRAVTIQFHTSTSSISRATSSLPQSFLTTGSSTNKIWSS